MGSIRVQVFFSFLNAISYILINHKQTNITEILLAYLERHKLNRVLSLRHSRVSWYVIVAQMPLSARGQMTEFRGSL